MPYQRTRRSQRPEAGKVGHAIGEGTGEGVVLETPKGNHIESH